MRLRSKLVLRSTVALVFVGCQTDAITSPDPTVAAPRAAVAPSAQAELTDHYVVGYTDYEMPGGAADVIAAGGGSIYEAWPDIGYAVVGGIDQASAAALRNIVGVTTVTRDRVIQWLPATEQPTSDRFEPGVETDQGGAFFFDRFQWNMRQIDADDAWLTTTQGAGARVAVLDTGVDPFHIDLAGKFDLNASTSTLSPGSSPCGAFDETTIFDLNFHGSFVSGLVSSNGLGMASVAPDATLIGVKVLNCTGSGSFADVIAGIIHATTVGADVINMSLGALLAQNQDDDSVEDAIADLIAAQQAAVDFAVANGVTVVASSGNGATQFDNTGQGADALDLIHVPSMLDGVLSVGATAPIAQADFDALASYTNFGQKGADVMAPGGDLVAGGVIEDLILSVCSSFVCGGSAFFILSSGTSFAAPVAAGTAAVAIAEGQDGDDCLPNGADRIDGQGNSHFYSRGRINVLGAAQCKRLDP